MAGYTQTDNGIFSSTLWWNEDATTFKVFFYIIGNVDKNGWLEDTIPGLAGVCRISVEELERVLEKLSSPDKYSRSQENEGRRIEIVEGKIRLLNYLKYRSKNYSTQRNQEWYYQNPQPHRKRQRATRGRQGGDEEAKCGDSESESESESETETEDPESAREDLHSPEPLPPDENDDLTELGEIIADGTKHYTGVVESWTVMNRHYDLHELRKWALAQGAKDWRKPICDSLEVYLTTSDDYVVKAGRPIRMWANDPGKWLRKASSGHG